MRVEPAAQREAFAQRRARGSTGSCSTSTTERPSRVLICPSSSSALPRDDLQQRRLAGAVAADEADALAFGDDEVGAVEQRMEAEGELGVLQGHERHGRRIVQSHAQRAGRGAYGALAPLAAPPDEIERPRHGVDIVGRERLVPMPSRRSRSNAARRRRCASLAPALEHALAKRDQCMLEMEPPARSRRACRPESRSAKAAASPSRRTHVARRDAALASPDARSIRGRGPPGTVPSARDTATSPADRRAGIHRHSRPRSIVRGRRGRRQAS